MLNEVINHFEGLIDDFDSVKKEVDIAEDRGSSLRPNPMAFFNTDVGFEKAFGGKGFTGIPSLQCN